MTVTKPTGWFLVGMVTVGMVATGLLLLALFGPHNGTPGHAGPQGSPGPVVTLAPLTPSPFVLVIPPGQSTRVTTAPTTGPTPHATSPRPTPRPTPTRTPSPTPSPTRTPLVRVCVTNICIE